MDKAWCVYLPKCFYKRNSWISTCWRQVIDKGWYAGLDGSWVERRGVKNQYGHGLDCKTTLEEKLQDTLYYSLICLSEFVYYIGTEFIRNLTAVLSLYESPSTYYPRYHKSELPNCIADMFPYLLYVIGYRGVFDVFECFFLQFI